MTPQSSVSKVHITIVVYCFLKSSVDENPQNKHSQRMPGRSVFLQSSQSQDRWYKNSHLPHSFRLFFRLSSPNSHTFCPWLSPGAGTFNTRNLKTNSYTFCPWLSPGGVTFCKRDLFYITWSLLVLEARVLIWKILESTVTGRVCGIFLVAGVLQHARITHTHLAAGGLDSFLPAKTAVIA